MTIRVVTEAENLEALAVIMTKHKIDEYTTLEGAVIKLSPLAYIEKRDPVKPATPEELKIVADEDLYYSSTKFKKA